MTTTITTIEQRLVELEKKMNTMLSNDSSHKKKDNKDNKDKKENVPEPDTPKKKRTSGYLLFSAASRPEVKDKLASLTTEDKPKTTDIMKELAKMWRELPDDQKATWIAKAKDA